MSNKLIDLRDLKKEFSNEVITTKVLHGISFSIDKGEYVAIMGPSGSGKSTLMHILGFLDVLTAGTYFFDKLNVSDFSEAKLAQIRNEKVGFVFQQFNLLAKTTVLENVKLPLIYSKKKNKEELAIKAIAAVGLEHRANYLSNQLSGGEKQRVAIARAIVNDPDIVFADEPTGNLDSKTGTQIMKIFEELNRSGRTIILVTHEQDTANHAKRIIMMRDGILEKDYLLTSRRSIDDGLLTK